MTRDSTSTAGTEGRIDYAWRGRFDNRELNALHAEAFGHQLRDDDWQGQVERHSLGWVCARESDELIGWVNVVWDGATHAFVLDTIVAVRARRRGVGVRMIVKAADYTREAGCEWMHVDFDDELTSFYIEACGFTPTPAGLIAL